MGTPLLVNRFSFTIMIKMSLLFSLREKKKVKYCLAGEESAIWPCFWDKLEVLFNWVEGAEFPVQEGAPKHSEPQAWTLQVLSPSQSSSSSLHQGFWFGEQTGSDISAVSYRSLPLFSPKLPCNNASQKTPVRSPPTPKSLGESKLRKHCRLNCDFQSTVGFCRENQPQALGHHQQWENSHWLHEN